MTIFSGRCMCGALTWESSGPMLWSALCHCEDCRRAASSDWVSWFGVPQTSITWKGPRYVHSTSEGVMRSNCETCGSPASYQSMSYPDEIHLYAASLDDPTLYHPKAHIFWSQRLPWIETMDDLEKHDRNLLE